jgi:hypothetical protein
MLRFPFYFCREKHLPAIRLAIHTLGSRRSSPQRMHRAEHEQSRRSRRQAQGCAGAGQVPGRWHAGVTLAPDRILGTHTPCRDSCCLSHGALSTRTRRPHPVTVSRFLPSAICTFTAPNESTLRRSASRSADMRSTGPPRSRRNHRHSRIISTRASFPIRSALRLHDGERWRRCGYHDLG